MEELSRAGAALIDAGKMPQLLALLGKFGVQAVTQLPKEAYSAFGAELKASERSFNGRWDNAYPQTTRPSERIQRPPLAGLYGSTAFRGEFS